MGAIDLKYFQLCNSCFHVPWIHDVNYGKICLANLRDNIKNNHFHENMPAYFVSATRKKWVGDDDNFVKATKKKKCIKDFKDPNKDKFNDLGDMVKNQQAVQD